MVLDKPAAALGWGHDSHEGASVANAELEAAKDEPVRRGLQ
jgi:hypothetical protein